MTRLLLLEDELALGGALLQSLAHTPYRVVWARSVAAAKELLARDAFALLIVDTELPDGTGGELVKQLRERHERRKDKRNHPREIEIQAELPKARVD